MQAIDLNAAVTLIACALYLLAAIFALLRREYRPQATWAVFAYATLSFLWSLEQALRRIGLETYLREDFLDLAPFYGILVLAITFLFLSRKILYSPGPERGWLSLGAVWIVGCLILDLNALGLPDVLLFRGGWALPRQALNRLVLIAGWAVFMAGAMLVSVQALRKAVRYYTVVSYWVLVLALTVIGDGMFFAGLQAPGSVARLMGTMLAAYVILMPRLPYFGNVLRRMMGFLIFTMIAIVLYTVGLIAAQLIVRNWTEIDPVWVGLFLALILVLVFNPVLTRVQKEVGYWTSGIEQDPTSLLRQYSQNITKILDLGLLATVAVGTASDFLDVGRGFLFLVDSEKGDGEPSELSLRGVSGMANRNPQPGKLKVDSPLAIYFRQEYKPLSQYDIDYQPRFRDLPPDEREWLEDLGVEIYVPLYAKNEWIGFLAFGPKDTGATYSASDLDLLSTMADQTAVALENTRLIEGLIRLNNDFRRAFAALEQANLHLERLDKTKSDFISIASHELRTPLTLISGSSQMLLEEADLQQNSYYQKLLSKIHGGTVRLHEIVDSLLDVAKIDTRALVLEEQPVSLASLIQTVCEDLKGSATDRNQTIEMQDLESLPPITADKDALRKVFYHLIVNAIKYTPDGGEITISGRALDADPDDLPAGGVGIVVSDTGIGIDPRFHELIFTKFYQTGELALHSSGRTKFKGGGPGLGLAIARGIVEAHQGRVWVESSGYEEQECPGSKFYVVLPLKPTGRALREDISLPE